MSSENEMLVRELVVETYVEFCKRIGVYNQEILAIAENFDNYGYMPLVSE
jgi:hypothetical protein